MAGLQVIPGAVYEAAKVEGASSWQRLRYITPGARLMFAITLTSTPERRPVPAAIAFFTGSSEFEIPLGTISAASICVTVPLIALVLLFQRRIVAGLTSGAVKG